LSQYATAMAVSLEPHSDDWIFVAVNITKKSSIVCELTDDTTFLVGHYHHSGLVNQAYCPEFDYG
ncbi:hypothetical protein, partial [Bacillus paralicheniformis]